MNGNNRATALLTDRAWPDDTVERAVLDAVGITLVTGPADAASAPVIESLVALHRPDAILTCWAPVSDAAIAASPALRVVARMGDGLDNIDVDAATRHGVLVTNVPDYCIEEVSDHAVALVLAWTRGIALADRQVRAGRWDPASARLRRLSALTCGVIGYGRIGRRTAGKISALGARVLAHTPHPPATDNGVAFVALDELLARSDAVIVHAPLTPATHHLLGARELALMPQDSLLVNVSRGGLVDTAALARALASGRLSGAGLDVIEGEPAVPPELFEHPGVVITPHIAFSSDASLLDLRRSAAEEVVRVLSGQAPRFPRNVPQATATHGGPR